MVAYVGGTDGNTAEFNISSKTPQQLKGFASWYQTLTSQLTTDVSSDELER
jgi:hypothetical protein